MDNYEKCHYVVISTKEGLYCTNKLDVNRLNNNCIVLFFFCNVAVPQPERTKQFRRYVY